MAAQSENMTGQMIDVGGHKVHVVFQGEGSPAVVIETAVGGLAAEWQGIQEDVAKVTRVLTYDRAGYGDSEPGSAPRTSRQVVAELRALLKGVGLAEPYIMVGHSQGGLYVNHFARLYPEEVAGVLLMDSLSWDDQRFEREIPTYGKMVNVTGKIAQMRMNRFMAAAGLLRLFRSAMKRMVRSLYPNLANSVQDIMLDSWVTRKYYDALVGELEGAYGSFAQVLAAGNFPTVPLAVMYHSPQKSIENSVQFRIPEEAARQIETLWEELNRDFLKLSPESRWIPAVESGHMIHQDQPSLVAETIITLVEKARKSAEIFY